MPRGAVRINGFQYGEDWRRRFGPVLPCAVVELATLRTAGQRMETYLVSDTAMLLAGDPAEIIAAVSDLTDEIGPRLGVSTTADVINLNGFRRRGQTARLLSSAVCNTLTQRPLGAYRSSRCMELLSERLHALPGARTAMSTAAAVMAGNRPSDADLAKMDSALRDVHVRFVCAEHGLDTIGLSGALRAQGFRGVRCLKSAWDQAMFGPDRIIDGVEPRHYDDYGRLHAVIRRLTGDGMVSWRMTDGLHQSNAGAV